MKTYNQTNYFRLNCFYFFEKFKLSQFSYSNPLLRICYQHLLNNLNRIHTNITWQHIESLNYFLIQLLRCFLLKRQRSTHHSVKNDAQRPNITNYPIICLTRHHLRWSVTWTATSRIEQLTILVVIRQSKIDELHIIISI